MTNYYTSYMKEQIAQRLRFDNPWWTSEKIPADLKQMKRRLYFSDFLDRVTDTRLRRSVILMGPRRVGKTVMMYHCIEELMDNGVPAQKIIFLPVDTPIYSEVPLEELFLQALEVLGVDRMGSLDGYYVFFDEIQYFKNWEQHLKVLVDSYRKVKWIASGSAAAALKMKSQESGAGRFTHFFLPPLSFKEYLHLIGKDYLLVKKYTGLVMAMEPEMEPFGHPNAIRSEREPLDTIDINEVNRLFLQYINFGGYPEIALSPDPNASPSQYVVRDIVDKVMLKDLPGLYGISDSQALNQLFCHIAFRAGGEFSYEGLSKESGISKPLVKKYLEFLEAAFLIKIINKVDDCARKLLRVTNFKVYLTNPSLRAALFSPVDFNDPMIGNMVENALFAQYVGRDDITLYYANWKKGRTRGEVDMVALSPRTLKPQGAVEIKWSERYFEHPGELQSLLDFVDWNHLSEVTVTSIKTKGTVYMDRVELHFVPAALYALSEKFN